MIASQFAFICSDCRHLSLWSKMQASRAVVIGLHSSTNAPPQPRSKKQIVVRTAVSSLADDQELERPADR